MFRKDQKIKKAIKQYQFSTSDTTYIGDESRDVKAAKKAGVKSIAVAWGFEGRKLLEMARPDKIIDKPSQLQGL